MKKFLILAATAMIAGCSATKEVVEVRQGIPGINGIDGTSCSVGPEFAEESEQLIGARISCTDGSFAVVLNGLQGVQGIQGVQGDKGDQGEQGIQGIQGIQGPVGETGQAGQNGQNGQSCQVYRPSHADYVNLSCPNQATVKIYDGKDGEDGHNGTNGTNGVSCSVSQLSNGARITCGTSVAFVYNGLNGTNGTNGTNGANGTSCSVSNANGGALITCGNTSQMIYDGQNGAVGPVGPQGPQGQPGQNALANAIGIEGYIYPCGINFSNDEIFLRLTDGKILALYDGGANQDRLVLLAAGNYITTDVNNQNDACHFNVSSDARPKVTSASGWPTSTGVVQ